MVDATRAAQIIGDILSSILAEPAEGDPSAMDTPAAPAATAESTATPTSTGFQKPVEGQVTGNFGEQRPGHTHAGVDIGVPVGTNVHAAIAGTVTHAATDSGGYGTWIEIQGDNGMSTRYAHLMAMNVQPGDQVTAGQIIGASGGEKGAPGAGNSEGPHLHFEVREGGKPVDPGAFLAGSGPITSEAAQPAQSAADTPAPTNPDQAVGSAVQSIMESVKSSKPVTGDRQTQAQTSAGTTTGQSGTGQWAQDILTGINAPTTPENLKFMDAWMRAEGGAVHNNPLNTKWSLPGATNWNSEGVKTYADYQTGLQATLNTLKNGLYGQIILALRQGTSAKAAAQALASSHWGTGDLVSKLLGG